MTTIRWRDSVLSPAVLAHVPVGYEAVTDPEVARPLMSRELAVVGLPPARTRHFAALWDAVLDRSMQPSGLLLLRLADLPPVIGHATTGTVGRWSEFCKRRGLWVRVPGKLYPYPRRGDETRIRAYLVVRPDTATG